MEDQILIIGIRFYIKKGKNCSATTTEKDSKIMTMESSKKWFQQIKATIPKYLFINRTRRARLSALRLNMDYKSSIFMIKSSLSYRLNYREVASALFCWEILLEIAISVRLVEANNWFLRYGCALCINLSVFLSANGSGPALDPRRACVSRKKGPVE